MQAQQTTINNKNSAYQTIGTDLANLQSDITTLSSAGFFQSATTASSDSTVATASRPSRHSSGNLLFHVSQMATAAAQEGSTVSAQPISATSQCLRCRS